MPDTKRDIYVLYFYSLWELVMIQFAHYICINIIIRSTITEIKTDEVIDTN